MNCREMLNFNAHLESLAERGKITSDQLKHFLTRGIQVISPENFGLDNLAKILPRIVIGASTDYIDKMKVPYQATSYLAANSQDNDNIGPFIYKINGRKAGGVPLLSGGKRKQIDNAFASTHRILIGRDAIMVSAVNLMLNKENIWNWHFFGDFFKENDRNIYEDLCKLEKKIGAPGPLAYIIVARSHRTFRRLNFIQEYEKNRIAVLDKKTDIHVIFLTNEDGYDFAHIGLPESDLLSYVVTGKEFDFRKAMQILRDKYHVRNILNDGGRLMSNGVRDSGLLAEERVTLEPYPGNDVMTNSEETDPTSILGKKGLGIDGGEMEGAILLHSIVIGKERANVYTYPLKDEIVL